MEKLHVQPSELDMLPYYEYEYIVEIYNDIIKQRQDEESSSSDMGDKYNIDSIKNNMNKNVASYKNPKLPKINMPKLNK